MGILCGLACICVISLLSGCSESGASTATPETPVPSPTETRAPTVTASTTVAPTATPRPSATPEEELTSEEIFGIVSADGVIPEMDASLPDSDPESIEAQIREMFEGQEYELSYVIRNDGETILQFERDDSVYAVRLTSMDGETGVVVAIRATDAESAFAEVPDEDLIPASFWELNLGDCLNPNEEAQTLDKVACDVPHYVEIVGVLDFPADVGSSFPSDDEWYDFMTYDCEQAFADYTGTYPLGAHDYWYSGIGPTEASWATGDREVVCFLFHVENAPMTTSARDEFK